ncbi:MAG: YgjV family protein [Clostridia bacterium]|nr:YgjV family protein [Clostridia bacterium]
MEFYLAQGISVLTGIVAVVMMQFKDMRKILIGQILANLLTASTYFLLGGFSGTGICLIAIVQTVTMFLYNLKQRPPHRAIIAVFVLLYIACSAFYYRSPVDLFSAMAAICYAFSVVQTRACLSRLWYLFNPLCWLIYDLFTRAYGNLVLHVVIFLSTLYAILHNDLRKNRKETFE